MRRSTLWMFLIAFLTAGVAVWMAYTLIRPRAPHPKPEVAKGPETTQVVIATSKISFAQKIEKNQIEVVAWPPGRVPEGVFNKKEDVEGKIAKQTIMPNEPVLRDRIVAMDQIKGSILAAFITPNKRAVSVRVSDVTGVGGFVLPGNQVDVIEAVKGKGSRILLENIKVLAVDQEADKDKPAVVKAVTLEVTPKQAETLVEVNQDNSIHLALRNPQDNGEPEKRRRTIAAFIAPNKRAVSVPVSDVTGVGGFILPGNRVDVIEVAKGKGSRILLENLKVLAVDQEVSPDKDKPAIVKAVTLEVTPEQAETLVGATQDSSIHLALRNPQDRGETEKYRRTLTVVRGDKVNIYKVNAYEAP